MAGGAGYVLSKEALRRFVEKGINDSKVLSNQMTASMSMTNHNTASKTLTIKNKVSMTLFNQ